ncbi:MAG: rhodanese-like domain-containing protein [Thermoanaerobaculia bacterium]
MALKTALLQIGLPLLLTAGPLPGQRSPIQWPVPPPGPPREVVLPRILTAAGELAGDGKTGLSFVFLDARETGFEAGHAAGAAAAWREAEEPEGPSELRSGLAARGISGVEAVVLYGDDRERVARLFWRLRSAGCKDVRILKGGLAAWRVAGGAIETGPSRREPAGRFVPPPDGDAAVGTDWVAQVFFREDVALLDLRDARGWDRWRTPPVYATGHIPSALPFDPRALLPADGGWPEPAALRERLGQIGARAGDPVPPGSTFVLYAVDGHDPRLGLAYLMFALAGLDARVYPAGWSGWRSDPARPVMRVISAAELAGLLKRKNPDLRRDLKPDGLVLLDLREARDFRIGHLPGAASLPFVRFPDVFQTEIAASWPQASRATPLVLYCYGIECVRSLKAGTQAARAGFRDLVWFRGGVQEWRDSGYPLLVSAPATRAPLPPASPGDEGGHP